jgi:hypothetical protein
LQAGDIVVFVHQPQGELEASEAAFLGQLRASFGADAASNIVVVLSKADKESADKIGKIEQRIAQQCAELLGFAPHIFRVSAKRHRDGSIRRNEALVAAGGVEALAAHLRELAADVQSVRAQKRLARIDALLEQVSGARAAALMERERLRAAVMAGFAVYNERIAQLRRFLDESASAFELIRG